MRDIKSNNTDTARMLVVKNSKRGSLWAYRNVWRNCRLAGSPQVPYGVCFQMHEWQESNWELSTGFNLLLLNPAWQTQWPCMMKWLAMWVKGKIKVLQLYWGFLCHLPQHSHINRYVENLDHKIQKLGLWWLEMSKVPHGLIVDLILKKALSDPDNSVYPQQICELGRLTDKLNART